MISQETDKALQIYSRELVARIADILDLSGSSPKLIAVIRETIYQSRDSFVIKMNINGIILNENNPIISQKNNK